MPPESNFTGCFFFLVRFFYTFVFFFYCPHIFFYSEITVRANVTVKNKLLQLNKLMPCLCLEDGIISIFIMISCFPSFFKKMKTKHTVISIQIKRKVTKRYLRCSHHYYHCYSYHLYGGSYKK